MDIVTKEEGFKKNTVERIASGAVFIYPTDTIYGIGCDATNDAAVKKVRKLKGRETKPFSVIAPSIEWIHQNCELSDKAKGWLVKLPGPYTLILPLKNPKAVCVEANKGLNTIGVRIPHHWIAQLAEAVNKPIISTSVNMVGQPPATTQEQLEEFEVDFIIYEGPLTGKPSTLVDLSKGEQITHR